MTNSTKLFIPPFEKTFLPSFGNQVGAFDLLSLDPIVLFDATNPFDFTLGEGADNLVLTGTLLVDQPIFTSLPAGWTNPGTSDSYASGEVIITLGNGSRFIRNIQANQTEMWVSYKWRASSDFNTTNINRGSGIQAPTNLDNILLGVGQSGGLKFRTSYNTDTGSVQVNTALPFVVNTDYFITIQYKTASAPAADDGIARIWIDGNPILNAENVDNDTLLSRSIILGQNSEAGDQSGSFFFDSAKMGTSGTGLIDISSFTERPFGWSAPGGGDTYSNGFVIIDSTNRSHNIFSNSVAGGPFTELWAKFKWTISSDFSNPSGQKLRGSGIDLAQGNTGATIGVHNDGGTLKFMTNYGTDSGRVETTHATPLPVLGQEIQIDVHWKAATAPAADDGVAQIWVDDFPILNVTDVDSDTLVNDDILLGSDGGEAGQATAGTFLFRDAILSETGEAPNSVSQWDDLSGNANHVTQTTEANRPIYDPIERTVTFNGVTQFLNITALAEGDEPQPLQYFVVMDHVSGTQENVVSGDDSSFRPFISLNADKVQMWADNFLTSINNFPSGFFTVVADFDMTVSRMFFDGGTSEIAGGNGDVGLDSLRGFVIGAGFGGFAPGAAVIKAVIVNSGLTDTQINQQGNFLANKFGQTWTDIEFDHTLYSPTAVFDSTDQTDFIVGTGPTAPFQIDEDFDTASNPPAGWTKTGNANVVSGELVCITSGGSEDHIRTPAFSTSDEKWTACDLSTDAGFVIATPGQSLSIFSLRAGTGSSRANIDLINDSGTIKWRTRIVDDAPSSNIVIHDSPVFVVGQKYRLTIHHVKATTAVSFDGGAQFWVNDVLMRSTLTLDNFDTTLPNALHMGCENTSVNVAGTMRIDNVLVSPTGKGVGEVTWLDLSGNSNDLDQTDNTKSPSYNTGIRAVDFDGVDEFLESGFFTANNQPVTMIAVMTYIDSSQDRTFIDGNGVAGENLELSINANNFKMVGANQLAGGTNDSNEHIFAATFNTTSSNLFVDGNNVIVNGDVGTDFYNGITMGAKGTGVAPFGEISVKFYGLYDALLTDDQINERAGSLNERFPTTPTWVDI